MSLLFADLQGRSYTRIEFYANIATTLEHVMASPTPQTPFTRDILGNYVAVDSGRRCRKALREPVSVNSRTSLRSAEMEIGKGRAETGARNPRPKDENARNCRPETGARQPNPREDKRFSQTRKNQPSASPNSGRRDGGGRRAAPAARRRPFPRRQRGHRLRPDQQTISKTVPR
jgi:hypothetical protein